MNDSQRNDEMAMKMDECIQNCLDCYRACLATVPHCLTRGGEHASQAHITMLLECAELCQTSARLMLIQSTIHGEVCGVCATACERCAEDCQRMGAGDAKMLNCADVCSRCAKTCDSMSAMAHAM
jgi:hypothetical protein